MGSKLLMWEYWWASHPLSYQKKQLRLSTLLFTAVPVCLFECVYVCVCVCVYKSVLPIYKLGFCISLLILS
jgi:hypothetical protein